MYPDEAPELPISAYHEADEIHWDAQIESQFEAWVAGQIAGSEAQLPREPALDLPGFLDVEASRLRRLGTPSASWLAAELEQLATEARRLETTTAEAFEHERAVAYWESARIVDSRAWEDGYRAGLAAGPGVASHHLAS